jgi:hypothetical protein
MSPIRVVEIVAITRGQSQGDSIESSEEILPSFYNSSNLIPYATCIPIDSIYERAYFSSFHIDVVQLGLILILWAASIIPLTESIYPQCEKASAR